jgi:hypothetical protein
LAGTGILPDSGGILIKYRNSCTQEFLQKIPVKLKKKNQIPVTLPKTHSCEKFLRKTQEIQDRNLVRNGFLDPKWVVTICSTIEIVQSTFSDGVGI